MTSSPPAVERSRLRLPFWVALLAFLAIAGFFLWTEHRAHLMGALPYALLLLCPLIHVLRHRGQCADATSSTPVITR